MHRTFNLLGPQGSGKGTQAHALVNHFDFYHIDMGEYLRNLVASDSELGREVADYLRDGQRVPAKLIAEVTYQALANVPPGQDVLFDGLMRGLDELEAQKPIFKELDLDLPVIIYLEVDEKTSIDRISHRRICVQCHHRVIAADGEAEKACPRCGGRLERRADDTPQAVARRLAWYNHDTVPVLDYFKQHGTVIEIDARPSIEIVTEHVIEKVEEYYAKHPH
jgi:adenylate kinase